MPFRKEVTIITSMLRATFFEEGTEMVSLKKLKEFFGDRPIDIHLEGDIKGTITLIPLGCGYTCQMILQLIEREPTE